MALGQYMREFPESLTKERRPTLNVGNTNSVVGPQTDGQITKEERAGRSILPCFLPVGGM